MLLCGNTIEFYIVRIQDEHARDWIVLDEGVGHLSRVTLTVVWK